MKGPDVVGSSAAAGAGDGHPPGPAHRRDREIEGVRAVRRDPVAHRVARPLAEARARELPEEGGRIAERARSLQSLAIERRMPPVERDHRDEIGPCGGGDRHFRRLCRVPARRLFTEDVEPLLEGGDRNLRVRAGRQAECRGIGARLARHLGPRRPRPGDAKPARGIGCPRAVAVADTHQFDEALLPQLRERRKVGQESNLAAADEEDARRSCRLGVHVSSPRSP